MNDDDIAGGVANEAHWNDATNDRPSGDLPLTTLRDLVT